MLCTKFLLQSLFCSLDQKRRRRNFRKRVGALRIGREPIFVTILLPDFTSGQAMRLAFSNFGVVVSVFKGRHKFGRSIRNGKRHVRIFSAGGDPAYCQGKFLSMEISRGKSFLPKSWCCATGAKLDICLARIALLSLPLKIPACPSLSRGTPSQNRNPIQPDPSAEILP